MIKAISYCVAAGLTLTAGATLFSEDQKIENIQSYIVQGANQSSMTQNIMAVGGEVTYSYKVIEAVSAKLTDQQRDQIKLANSEMRFFNDTDVAISGESNWSTTKALKFKLNRDKVNWEAKNRTETDAYIAHVDLSWPAANGALTDVKVGGRGVYFDKPESYQIDMSATSARITLVGERQIKIEAGKKLEFEMEFDHLLSVLEKDYAISATMVDGTVVELNPQFDKISPSPIRYKTDESSIVWKTRNQSERDKYVRQVEVEWPKENGDVNSISINRKELVVEPMGGGKAKIEIPEYLFIEQGDDIDVEMEFEQLGLVDDYEYSVTLEYADGQFLELATTNATPEQGRSRDTFYPAIVNADEAHARGITGHGVTVAIIDTGFDDYSEIKKNTTGDKRQIQEFNVTDLKDFDKVDDDNGHGTHIASIIANSSATLGLNGELKSSYNGVAPDANLVIVKAFDEEGRASYDDILRAIDYVVNNKELLNIKVLNLSFSATPSSYYWDDPINQAVMRAWEAGITVVAAAGNQGPDAMTIGVPGNTPYVITVGAMSDNYTTDLTNDDFITSFSSAGPTFEGFVKPDMVAPGGHIQGLMNSGSFIGENYDMYDDDDKYFILSGSSQATAITSGIVALMLQNDPSLTPDDIKCRLMYSAKVAVKDDGNLAFSVFQQGAGLVDAISAIDESAVGCGNAGLDIAADLAGDDHFVGPVRRHENDGDFYIPGTEGLDWNGIYQDSQLWGNVRFMSNSQLWGNIRFNSDSQLWGNVNSELDTGAEVNSDSQLWGNVRFNSNSQLWGNVRFNSDSQLWGNVRFFSDSQLWGNVRFDSSSQLWGNVRFNSDSQLWGNVNSDVDELDVSRFAIKWIDHE